VRNIQELTANLPTAKVVGVECQVVASLGPKERMCAIVEYNAFVNAYSMTNGAVQLLSRGKTRAPIPLHFFTGEPRGKKKIGWTMKACQLIWSHLGGGYVTLVEIKKTWPNIPVLITETQRLIEEMRMMDIRNGRKAKEDSIRRDARKFIDECEKWKFDASEIMSDEVNLYHVEKVMES
jgi:hypothetical protein